MMLNGGEEEDEDEEGNQYDQASSPPGVNA
jgi:hypothetical protein